MPAISNSEEKFNPTDNGLVAQEMLRSTLLARLRIARIKITLTRNNLDLVGVALKSRMHSVPEIMALTSHIGVLDIVFPFTDTGGRAP
jgi:hypothetical protein